MRLNCSYTRKSAKIRGAHKRASGRVQLRHRTPTALTDTRSKLEAADVHSIAHPTAHANNHATGSKNGGR
jgi:hypothetical protein